MDKEQKILNIGWILCLLMLCCMMYWGHGRRVELNNDKTLLEAKCDSLTTVIHVNDSLDRWKQKRYNNRLKITLKQNEIIDRFRSSKNAKLADTELMELMYKID